MRILILNLVVLLALLPVRAQTAAKAGVLPADEVERLMPGQVFFHSQTATVQLRNSSALRYADGTVTLAGLVDTSGYSSAQRETYQFYLLTDVPLRVEGGTIAPGAYGCGFVPGKGFIVMDLGGNPLLHSPVMRDAVMARPRPLQFVAPDAANGSFRLYLGREYVTLSRAS